MRAVLLLLVPALAAGCRATDRDGESGDPRPNVLLIVADDMGYGDVGCFGGDLATPHLDRLAAGGARLTSFYVAAPVCTPSRYALMTGRHPVRARNGLDRVLMMLDPAHAGAGLAPDEPTFAELLRGAGYRTALVGKWHLGHGGPELRPTSHGFETFYGAAGGCVDYFTHRYGAVPDWWRGAERVEESGYATDLLTDEAVRFLRERREGRPFLLVLSHLAPHYGKSVEGALSPGTLATRPAGATARDPATGAERALWNTLQARPADLAALGGIAEERRRHYAAMVKALDDGVGRVLDELDAQGLAQSTVVVFTPDHGADATPSSAGSNGPLRGAKHSLWEGGVRVPAIVRWPGVTAPGSEVAAVGSALDLAPTFAAAAGASVEGLRLDGVDLRAAWSGGPAPERVLVWAHGRSRAIRRGRWKLVGDELHDLAVDPREADDVAAAHPDVARALADQRAAELDRLAAR